MAVSAPSNWSTSDLTPEQTEKFWSLVVKGNSEDDCWDWAGGVKDGIPLLNVYQDDNKRTELSARRLSFFLETGRDQRIIRSKCGNRCCLNPGHLKAREETARRPGTPERLTQEQIAEIKTEMNEPGKHGMFAEMARRYGISAAMLSNMRFGKKHRDDVTRYEKSSRTYYW